jgi:secreted PhoX family phosphatase
VPHRDAEEEARGDDERGDRVGSSFLWRCWAGAGDVSEGGGGFACPDNLAFDKAGNLWFCTDITTTSHNLPVTRQGDSAPGGKLFPGIFGNNALFMVPTRGPRAGQAFSFATGPMEAEMTGHGFTSDGALLLSIQHPGEDNGARRHPAVRQPDHIRDRELQLVDRAGQPFLQLRDVPLGSNFPTGQPGAVPRPALLLVRPAARGP